jgi:hypothetical protein
MSSKTIGKTSSNAFRKAITKTSAMRYTMLTVVLASAALLGQSKPAPPSSPPGLEFPVVMRQNVAAGKTPVGAKVQAKLALATLVNGVVVPQDAILSGEVTESVAKSATDPSRLAIRMDSAQWKNGSAPIEVYLTPWYYPVALLTNQNLADEPPGATHHVRPYNRTATYPDPNSPASQPFPDPDRDSDNHAGPAPPASASSTSQRRVLMKDVESTRQSNGAVTLTSKRSNIKLDKTTTYVLAVSDPLSTK